MKSSEIVVEIDEEAFRNLPDSGPNAIGKQWAEKEDQMLLKYWPIKKHSEVARLLQVSSTTALKRYRELTSETD